MSWTTTASNWMSAAGDYAVDAFNWLNDNPAAANVLGGVASGAGQYYMQKKQAEDDRAFQMDMYKRQYEDSRGKPGEVTDYDSHRQAISRGLLSNGMVTGG